jgi:hypothetical protein
MTVIEIEPDVEELDDDEPETCDPDDYPFPGLQPSIKPEWGI